MHCFYLPPQNPHPVSQTGPEFHTMMNRLLLMWVLPVCLQLLLVEFLAEYSSKGQSLIQFEIWCYLGQRLTWLVLKVFHEVKKLFLSPSWSIWLCYLISFRVIIFFWKYFVSAWRSVGYILLFSSLVESAHFFTS